MKPADKIKFDLMYWCRSGSGDIILPNFYVGQWEMDVCVLKPSGYTTEYEIKISRSDFKADFNKSEWSKQMVKRFAGREDQFDNKLKHDQIKSGMRCNRFFFVVPFQMVLPEDVPDHCGLIYHREGTLTIVKNAPLLGKSKFSRYDTLARKVALKNMTYQAQIRQAQRANAFLNQTIKELELTIKSLQNPTP